MERIKALRPVYLGDDLFACQPIAQAIMDGGGDFLMSAKPKSLYAFMDGAECETISMRRRDGAKTTKLILRWFTGAPLREGKGAPSVNWIGVTITDAKGKGAYDGAFVTSLAITHRKMLPRSPTAPGQGGKSRTRASTFSKTTAITSNIISAMAKTISP